MWVVDVCGVCVEEEEQMRPLFCSFCPVGLSPTPSPTPYPTSTTDDSEFACLLDIIYNIFILTATPLQGSPQTHLHRLTTCGGASASPQNGRMVEMGLETRLAICTYVAAWLENWHVYMSVWAGDMYNIDQSLLVCA